MPQLFGVDIAGIIGQVIGPLVLPATLRKMILGTRSGDLTDGTQPTHVDYAARGFIEDYKDKDIDGTLIRTTDRKITLLGATIASSAVPEPQDTVTIEGKTFYIIKVLRDPAAATYNCQVRAQ